MEEKADFSYEAKLPDKGKKLGLRTVTKEQKFSMQEQQLVNRVLGRVKLPNMAWDAVLADLKNNEPKNAICAKYGIPPADLKWIKRWLGY